MHSKIISSRSKTSSFSINTTEWNHFIQNKQNLIKSLKRSIPDTRVSYESSFEHNPKHIQSPVYGNVIDNLRPIAEYLNYFANPMTAEKSASFSNKINTAVNLILEEDIFNHHPRYQPEKAVRTELIHLKIASMETLLYSLLLMDDPNTIKDSFEKMMHHLNLENPCRATCLNSMMAHFLKISFTLFPESTSMLVMQRVDRFIGRLSLDDVLSKKMIVRDMLHFCSRILLEFNSIKTTLFKHLSDSHLKSWNEGITFMQENQLDPKDSHEYYNNNQLELVMLLAIIFKN